ncbi:MAG TPA: helix-turn-helix domain-containing protein [Polyangiaceae bacterium]|nr:helix-turn-helix domain-containing protein [Polyangiaceae bacterium]
MSTGVLLIYAAVITQACFVVVLLVTRPRERTANRLLAAPIFLVGVSALYTLYVRAGWYAAYPGWLLSIDTLPALYGPLFYLYARAASGAGLGRRPWLHAAPFVAYSLFDLPRFLLPGPDKLTLAMSETLGLSLAQTLWQWGVELQGLSYLLACQVLLHRQAPPASAPALDRRRARWLRIFFASLLALWFGSMLARATGQPILIYVHLGLASLLYAIAYSNAASPELFGREAPAADVVSAEPMAEVPVERYRKARLERDQAAEIAERLRELFDAERPHLDPEFGLPALAERLGASVHQVSQVLNETLGQSFYDYVNALRIEAVKQRLLDPACADVKLLSIGLECGFSSKSAFNNNFKKALGMTPSEFRRQALEGQPAKVARTIRS